MGNTKLLPFSPQMATAEHENDVVVVRCGDGWGCRVASLTLVLTAASLFGLHLSGQIAVSSAPCPADVCAGRTWTVVTDDEAACHRWTPDGLVRDEGKEASDCPNECDALHFRALGPDGGGVRRRLKTCETLQENTNMTVQQLCTPMNTTDYDVILYLVKCCHPRAKSTVK